jgi:Transposase DDE domain group 1
MHGVRAAIPRTNPLANCEFATLRERLIKIGARVIEHIARIRVQLPTSCPEGALFRAVALGLLLSGPRGCVPDEPPTEADQPQTRCTASRLTPIQPVGSPARAHSPDVQKRATSCMITARVVPLKHFRFYLYSARQTMALIHTPTAGITMATSPVLAFIDLRCLLHGGCGPAHCH